MLIEKKGKGIAGKILKELKNGLMKGIEISLTDMPSVTTKSVITHHNFVIRYSNCIIVAASCTTLKFFFG